MLYFIVSVNFSVEVFGGQKLIVKARWYVATEQVHKMYTTTKLGNPCSIRYQDSSPTGQ